MQWRYFAKPADMKPKFITDGQLAGARRPFIVEDHGIRLVKDARSHDILRAVKEAEIKVASSRFEMPPLQIREAAQPFEKGMDNHQAGHAARQ